MSAETDKPAPTWDETCPECGGRIGEWLNQCFIDGDNRTEFKLTCLHCGEKLAVDVHSVPEFEVAIFATVPKTEQGWFEVSPSICKMPPLRTVMDSKV